MKRFATLSLASALLLMPVLVGCDQTEKTQVQEKVQDPNGTTTHTVTDKVEKSGDHKTPAPNTNP